MSRWISCGVKLLHCNWTEIIYGIVIILLLKGTFHFMSKYISI